MFDPQDRQVQRNFAYVDFSDAASQDKAIQFNGQVIIKSCKFVIFEIYEQTNIILFILITLFKN